MCAMDSVSSENNHLSSVTPVFCEKTIFPYKVGSYRVIRLAIESTVTRRSSVNLAWYATVAAFRKRVVHARLIRIESDRMRIPIRLQGCLQELPILYRFSMPVALGGLVSAPMRWLCSVILVNTPQGYFYAGLYYASFRLRSLFQVLGDAISHCMLPLMASPEGYKNTTLQRAIFFWWYGYSASH